MSFIEVAICRRFKNDDSAWKNIGHVLHMAISRIGSFRVYPQRPTDLQNEKGNLWDLIDASSIAYPICIIYVTDSKEKYVVSGDKNYRRLVSPEEPEEPESTAILQQILLELQYHPTFGSQVPAAMERCRKINSD